MSSSVSSIYLVTLTLMLSPGFRNPVYPNTLPVDIFLSYSSGVLSIVSRIVVMEMGLLIWIGFFPIIT
jgi:hypothetical protein